MMGKKVSLNQRWLNGNAELLSAHREGWTATQWASLTPIQLYSHVSNGHRPRLYASYAAMSAGPTMRGVVTVEESLSLSVCLSLPFLLSIEKKRFSRIPREDSGPLSWRGNEGRVEHTPTSVGDSNGIILYYTRTGKRKKRRTREGKKKISVEKLNNQAVCSREGRFITINTFALMEHTLVPI